MTTSHHHLAIPQHRPTHEQQHVVEVTRIAKEVAAANKVPGISIAVAASTGIRYAGAVGYADLTQQRPATAEDQYPWFSMTKIATATAAMRLQARGALDLDAPIGTYLPAYRQNPKRAHPTMRQLLTHTAGLGNPMPIRWVRPEHAPAEPNHLERIVRKHGNPRRNAGHHAAYSNIGYLLAGQIVQAVSGHSLEEAVEELVLEPMGMADTDYRYRADAPRATGYVRLPSAMVPALRMLLPDGIVGPRVAGYTSLKPFLVNGAAYGGLIGTVTDAAMLASAHAVGASDEHPLLGQVDFEQMRAITHRGRRFDHGIGWFRRPVDADRSPAFVEHYGTGGGFWNAMRIYPQDGLAMVAMANTTAKWNVDNLFTRLKELTWT